MPTTAAIGGRKNLADTVADVFVRDRDIENQTGNIPAENRINFRKIAPADPPTDPISPNTRLNIGAGAGAWPCAWPCAALPARVLPTIASTMPTM